MALEIKSNQQPVLDAAMKGKASVSAIRIHPIIDHSAYRHMLTGFADLITKRNCLSVHAIDAPQNVHVNRDKWMEERISDIGKGALIIDLLGNLHALKYVDWHQGIEDEVFLAERLQSTDIDVFSVIQHWSSGGCKTRQVKFVATDTPEGNMSLAHVLEPVAADFPDNPYAVIDEALVWKCQE